jgi:hypothetical protein
VDVDVDVDVGKGYAVGFVSVEGKFGQKMKMGREILRNCRWKEQTKTH